MDGNMFVVLLLRGPAAKWKPLLLGILLCLSRAFIDFVSLLLAAVVVVNVSIGAITRGKTLPGREWGQF